MSQQFSMKHEEEGVVSAASQLPEQMAACFLKSKGTVELKKCPVPTPGYNELLVKIERSGVCRTDLALILGQMDFCKHKDNLIVGHEGVGTIAAFGPGVEKEHLELKLGDRVGVPWLAQSCRNCDMCLSGHENLCPKGTCTGCTVNGTYAEYAVVSAPHVTPIPENLSSEQAAPILCSGVTGYAALERSKVRPGEFVCIVGAAGGVGHLAVQYAKAMGMKVVAIEHTAEKTEWLKSLGCDHVFDSSDPGMMTSLMALTGGGCHGSLVVAPSTKAYETAFRLTRPGGRLVCVAMPPEPVTSIPLHEVIFKQLSIKGSLNGTRKQAHEALQFAADNKVKCRITRMDLAQVGDILDTKQFQKFAGNVVLNCEAKEG